MPVGKLRCVEAVIAGAVVVNAVRVLTDSTPSGRFLVCTGWLWVALTWLADLGSGASTRRTPESC